MTGEDEGIRPVGDVRKQISAEFGNDPSRLAAHDAAEQERYRDRVLPGVAARRADAVDDAARHR